MGNALGPAVNLSSKIKLTKPSELYVFLGGKADWCKVNAKGFLALMAKHSLTYHINAYWSSNKTSFR